MLSPRLASRYAKSLLDLAVERGQLEAVYADMQYLRDLIRSSRELAVMLKSPVVSSDKKQAVINAVTDGKISELTLAFTRLLIAKHREGELVEIVPAFMTQYRAYKGIHTVKLTTATPVSEEAKAKILAQVRGTSDIEKIELETSVNPDLIGGFVLQTGDKLVDASVAYELKEIGRQFEKNDFIYKLV
ncbi:MAG: ATP synthase F1 subunit delta [Sphingobacteriales bacterium]|nr:MAG: ATP synthase F1 subunit delta [Sphingobacteriales bacterium]